MPKPLAAIKEIFTGGGVGEIIGKFVKDKDAALALEAELTREMIEKATAFVAASRDVIVAEAQGESWLQRSWRPITMLVFVFIIFNNYVLAPYFAAFGAMVPTLDIPNGMWALLNVGIGGYIASRGVEKVVLGKKD